MQGGIAYCLQESDHHGCGPHGGPPAALTEWAVSTGSHHRLPRTAQGLLVVGGRQRGVQLGALQGRAQADGVDGVGVARHEREALGVVAVRAQQRQDLVVGVRQDHVALRTRLDGCTGLAPLPHRQLIHKTLTTNCLGGQTLEHQAWWHSRKRRMGCNTQ